MISYVLCRSINSRTYMFYEDYRELVHDILQKVIKVTDSKIVTYKISKDGSK